MKTLNYFKIYILLLIPVFICEGQEPTSVQKTKPQKGNTEITGDEFEMVSREKENYFLFSGIPATKAPNQGLHRVPEWQKQIICFYIP